MANGRLATLDITNAATDVQLYAAATGKTTSFSLCLTNRNAIPVKVRIALTDTTSVQNDEYIAFDHTIYPYESYERSGLVIRDGQFVYVRSTVTGVSVVLCGYEE